MVYKYDFLVIGSGIAGMSYALKVAKYGKVAIIAKNKLEDANTFYAQGGIASVTNPWDNFEKHIDDTLDAGGGLCDPEVVKKVVNEAPAQIRELINWGVDFDKDDEGNFDLVKAGIQNFVFYIIKIVLELKFRSV